ncbi:TRAP transporter substrate-binding protein [Brevibacillus reuszeri]|uniref:TRAP transporter substrate-binding protein n=1 Tax=Brevibacillus reuszeri TaxID=54915 RepID=UPI001BB36BA4|nr:TRAP transporter substrate-binding protein [Brevibacillus reuszeri]
MNKIASVLIGIALVLGLIGCSASASNGVGNKRIISIATVQPENHSIAIALYAFRDYIEKNLGDKFDIRIFTNSVMGGNSEALELLQMGSLDMVATSGSNLEAFSNEYKIFSLPYLFKDEASFRKAMNNEDFINEIYNSTAENGIKGVAWFANGVNNFYASKKIETPEDLKGLKIRVQSSDANVKLVQAFDAAAVVMAYGEVYTAMQNHVIDAGTNPEMALVSMKHGEVAKYYSRTEHQIFTDMLVVSTKFMDSLTEEEKEIFQKGFKRATQVQNEEWDKQTLEVIEEAKKMGVEFITVDKKPFEEIQKPVREELLNMYPKLRPLYDKVQAMQN